MERRRAITTAGAATLTLVAGAAAIALGSGIVDGRPSDDVGNLTPVTVPVDAPVTLYIDPATGTVTATSPTTPGDGRPALAPSVATATAPPVTTSSASTIADHESGDDKVRDDDHEGDEREHDDSHEYEGADDDD